jgi:undecaprenyl-diphosphatase
VHGFERRRDDAITVVVGVIIIVTCGLIAQSGTVGSLEATVFRAINGLPEALSPIMTKVQLIGILAVGPAFAIVALIFRKWRLAIAGILVTVGKLLAERSVWQFVQRERPGVTIADAIVRGDTATNGLSFVSGHVVLLVGLAVVIEPYLEGRWRVIPWLVAALVILARVYLGAHAPLDVLGGFGVGLIVGGLVNLIVGVPSEATEQAAAIVEV